MTERLARIATRHPWRTIGGWVGAVVLALVAAVLLLPGALTTDTKLTNNPESFRAEAILAHAFPRDPHGFDEVVIVRSETTTIGSPRFLGFVHQFARALRPAGASTVDAGVIASADRHALLIPVREPGDIGAKIGRAHV